uniref:Putative secreted protein n=1 Tax=Xenopsylla cheopis TaxID=163159 RepID=A0A6M2DYI1_XENCH
MALCYLFFFLYYFKLHPNSRGACYKFAFIMLYNPSVNFAAQTSGTCSKRAICFISLSLSSTELCREKFQCIMCKCRKISFV